MEKSCSAEKPRNYQLCHGAPILLPRKGCPGSQPRNQTLLLPPLSPVLRTFSYHLSLLYPVSTPDLPSLCTSSLPGSPLNLQLQDEPFITNQLFELHFPQFQQLYHSETHDMGFFLKTNLKREKTLPRKTS